MFMCFLFIGFFFCSQLEIQFLAIFGQYSFQQYFFGSLSTGGSLGQFYLAAKRLRIAQLRCECFSSLCLHVKVLLGQVLLWCAGMLGGGSSHDCPLGHHNRSLDVCRQGAQGTIQPPSLEYKFTYIQQI